MMDAIAFGKQQLERQRLEKLFGLRFSHLNIEDEYAYNLSYLLKSPANQFVFQDYSKNLHHTSKSPYALSDAPKLKTHLGAFTKNTGLILDDEKPEKQSPERDTNRTHFSNQPCLAANKSSNQTLNRYLTNGGRRLNSSDYITNRTSSMTSTKINSNNPSAYEWSNKTSAVTNLRANYGSNGLHVYVTEVPSKGYKTMIQTDMNKRTVTCDSADVPHTASVVRHRPKTEYGYRCNNMSENKKPKIASRVEALMALINSNKSSQQYNNAPSISPVVNDVPENSNVTEKRATKPSQVKLQRSSTFTAGQSNGRRGAQFTEYCFSCCKRIYPMDRISIEERVYHKSCFKCAICQRTVLPGTFACLDGIILCKPHYIEQFRRSGRYELRSTLTKDSEFEHSEDVCQLAA